MKKSFLVLLLVSVLVLVCITPVSATLRGDIDGTLGVSASDARLVLRAAVGLDTLNEAQSTAADVDGEPGISASDARLILRAAVGLQDLGELEGVHVHAYKHSRITREPTCTDNGTEILVCECGKEISRSIAAVGHDFRLTYEEASTCLLKGKRVFTCTHCQESKYEYTDKTEHDFQLTEVKPAGCEEGGYNFYECSFCGKAKKDNLAPTGHNYDSRTGLCKACGCADPGFCAEILPGEKWIVDGNWEIFVESVINHPLHEEASNKANGYTDEQSILITYKVRSLGYTEASANGTELIITPSDFEVYDEAGATAAFYSCSHSDYVSVSTEGTKDSGFVPVVLKNNSGSITFIISKYDSDGVLRKARFTAEITD